MVSLAVDNSKGMRFTVMWKMKGGKRVEKRTYNVTNLQECARVLFHAENVTRESVDNVYIHQHFDDGRVLEVVAIDNGSADDINPNIIFSNSGDKPTTKRAVVLRNEEKFGDQVVSAVQLALQKAKGTLPKTGGGFDRKLESQAKPNLKLMNKEGLVRAGIFYQAYPAESRPKEIKK